MRVFLLGATGNTGKVFLEAAVAKNHRVTCFVRDAKKLLPHPAVRVIQGSIDDSTALQEAMRDHDVVVNCAGYVSDEGFVSLVQQVMNAAEAAVPKAKFWFFGGAAVLDVPGFEPLKMVKIFIVGFRFSFLSFFQIDCPLIPKMYQRHAQNLAYAEKLSLDWSMLCPGPMVDGPQHDNLRISTNAWPGQRPYSFWNSYCLPFVFRNRIPDLTISYRDAVDVILANLERGGPLSRKRVGVALPDGVYQYK
jgi:hypothetical protein